MRASALNHGNIFSFQSIVIIEISFYLADSELSIATLAELISTETY
jgi:hypothetical protein